MAVKAGSGVSKVAGEYAFKGSYANAEFTNGYKLNEVGDFFELQDDATEKPFRAYFALADESTSASARVLRVANSETDGIETIENGALGIENAPVYNLNGQRLQQLQRGVNIVNGKKIIIK